MVRLISWSTRREETVPEKIRPHGLASVEPEFGTEEKERFETDTPPAL